MRRFIWKNGVVGFGIPVAFAGTVWAAFDTGGPDRSIAGLVFGVLVGTAVGALFGGALFGWIMWHFFAQYHQQDES